VVLSKTNDGRLHLEQAFIGFESGKPMFIDKPVAASLSDVMAIMLQQNNISFCIFFHHYDTCSVQDVVKGKIGTVLEPILIVPQL